MGGDLLARATGVSLAEKRTNLLLGDDSTFGRRNHRNWTYSGVRSQSSSHLIDYDISSHCASSEIDSLQAKSHQYWEHW